MSGQATKAEGLGQDRCRHTAPRWTGLLMWLFVFVLALSLIAAVLFFRFRKLAGRAESAVTAPPVEVRKLVAADIPVIVQGPGIVRPKVEVEVMPEVAGTVVFLHSDLKAGGIIRANEKIIQIDSRDYELAVRQARAAVAEAQALLELESADTDRAPALREPRIQRARAALDSARTQLEMAELKLQRTTIALPFDAMITSGALNLGQYVAVGQPLVTACGIDAFEVEVLLESDDLAWFDAFPPVAPLDGTDGNLAPAEVQADLAGGRHTWSGHVTRTTGQVDRVSRRVPVVVEVPRPLDGSESRPPLLPGTFVHVRITGKTLPHAVAIPRQAVHEPNRLWLVRDGRLLTQSVEIVRTDEEYAYVTSGLPDEVLIVTSKPDGLVEGMAWR
mgnify:CR=1 FL=1